MTEELYSPDELRALFLFEKLTDAHDAGSTSPIGRQHDIRP